jgi:uncharacterized membrane protein
MIILTLLKYILIIALIVVAYFFIRKLINWGKRMDGSESPARTHNGY